MNHVGIAIPQDVADLDGEIRLRDYLQTAESLGFDGLWASESGRAKAADPLSALSFAAAVTDRPALGTAVLISNRRAPLQLAHSLASIDRLSRGRLITGVGIGNGSEDYPRYGLDPAHRATRFEHGIELMKRLWTQDRVTFHDAWWTLDDVRPPLHPIQKPHPPIWFGARKPKALERAARLGDGWIGAGSASPSEFETSLETLRPLLSEYGRRDDFAIAKRVYIHVGNATADTYNSVRAYFASHYGNADLAASVAVVGGPARCGEHLAWLANLGVTHVILHPMVDISRQAGVLARHVVDRDVTR